MGRMIEKQCAIEIRRLGLEAVSRLAAILEVAKTRCDKTKYEDIRIGVGRSIGSIQMEILEPINSAYPDLDDLK